MENEADRSTVPRLAWPDWLYEIEVLAIVPDA
jgi:hypothetical protein